MLATLKTAKQYMSIPEDDTSEDLVILTALQAASAAIERETNRSFEKRSYNQTLDGPGTKFLRLRNYPVHSVTKLDVCGKDWLGREYSIESENGMLFYRSGWPCGARLIEVEYIAGYILPSDEPGAPEPTLPKNYELACILYAQMLMREQGVTSERVGDISVTYKDEGRTLPGVIKTLIQL